MMMMLNGSFWSIRIIGISTIPGGALPAPMSGACWSPLSIDNNNISVALFYKFTIFPINQTQTEAFTLGVFQVISLKNIYIQNLMQEPFINNQRYPTNQIVDANPYAKNDYPQPPTDPAGDMPYRNSEFGEDLNRLKTKQSSMHCQAFIGSFFLIGGVTTACVLQFASSTDLGTGGFIGIICGSYVLYLIIGCCCNPLTSYLGNTERGENFETYYNQVRSMIGRFTFHAECYHYETRHHTRIVRDSDGNTRTEHYTTTQKVVTHTATEYLTPYETRDQSGKIDRIRSNTNIVFIHFFVRYRFNDPQSSYNFENAYANFKMRHTRDVHQSFTMGYGVPGLIERKAFYVGALECDFATWFYLFSIIGLMWPYSLWVESKISRFDVDTMKVLKV